jgi:type VII secretion-associated serine protease mycosin
MRRAVASIFGVIALLLVSAPPAVADTARRRQWYLQDLNLADVHKITRGGGVSVALIDTGVDARHRDLAGAVLPGYNTRRGEFEDATGRKDLDGHGTNMAGIIAGRGRGPGDGVLGIASESKILPIGAPIDALASSAFMTEAVDFAIARHAGVINMSFSSPDDVNLHDAIRKAQAADMVLVASSGNRDKGKDNYPGAYPEVLTVGAYGKNRKITPFSVTGPQVDLTAPGEQVVGTGIGPTGYDLTSGTSEAAAVVSGAAALVRARYPELSAAEVVHRLTATADDAGPAGRDDAYGYGRLNLLKALTADVAPLPAASAVADPQAGGPVVGGPTSAVDIDDVPRAVPPLLLVAAVAGVLVVLGAVIAILMVVRRRRVS